eukprot:2139747-Lingulodinium_polyedra.AAC.1
MLEVCHNIPYLKPGSPLCRPRKRVAKCPRFAAVKIIVDSLVNLAGSSSGESSGSKAAPRSASADE